MMCKHWRKTSQKHETWIDVRLTWHVLTRLDSTWLIAFCYMLALFLSSSFYSIQFNSTSIWSTFSIDHSMWNTIFVECGSVLLSNGNCVHIECITQTICHWHVYQNFQRFICFIVRPTISYVRSIHLAQCWQLKCHQLIVETTSSMSHLPNCAYVPELVRFLNLIFVNSISSLKCLSLSY